MCYVMIYSSNVLDVAKIHLRVIDGLWVKVQIPVIKIYLRLFVNFM